MGLLPLLLQIQLWFSQTSKLPINFLRLAHGVKSLSLQDAQRPSRSLGDLIVNNALDRRRQKVLG